MHIDFTALTAYQRYKLMASLIVPRPIALVTTLGLTGVVNAAPFSMFNMVGEDPPLVMVSVNRLNGEGRMKDTAANILRHGEFVVHLPDEGIAAQMHACGDSLPPEHSEVDAVGFTLQPSQAVSVPTIVEAPVAFECVLHEQLTNESRHVFFGRVLALHAREGLIDTERWRVRLQDYFPVARFGASFYTRSRDRFAIAEPDEEARSTPIDEI
ncbi:flavin reductase family protein [Ideonella azotifigens]|uniref:Flavin reductase family protein n=1 Tax=Ideonella azotifigens TaxID=513160 RepID=A0ABN1K3E2_9BURK|nr:flavin reductase family protein [Ideonella azotifigens]MCD2344616.1 flavin reductase family protein [Ideonella azotifigens]